MSEIRPPALVLFIATALCAMALVVFTPFFDEPDRTTASFAENNAGPVPTKIKAAPLAADGILTVAEYFKMLTERSFDNRPADLLGLTELARQSFNEIKDSTPRKTASEIDALILEIQESIEADNRPVVAIDAIEGYKQLIEASNASDMSKAISLLDYAALRIQADLKCEPPRWEDISGVFDFASSQWRQVAPRLEDSELADKFKSNLDSLGIAIANTDQDLAESAVVQELELVDALKLALTEG